MRQSPAWTEAKQRRENGEGWENIVVHCGLTEAEARFLVFGREAYAKWAMKWKKAS